MAKQQFRWARGALEVVFIHNPFFKRGLSTGQRVEYLSSASYHLNGAVVLVDAMFPVIFFFTGAVPFQISTNPSRPPCQPIISLNAPRGNTRYRPALRITRYPARQLGLLGRHTELGRACGEQLRRALGARRAGMDAVHRDPVRREIERQRLGHAGKPRLGRDHVRAVQGAFVSRKPADVNNGSRARAFQLRQRRLEGAHATLQQSVGVEGGDEDFTVDGTPGVADVFIDPLHTGAPTAAERRWRTVAIGGLREGGSSYFALDVTQPDTVTLRGDGVFLPNANSDAVPGCINGPNTTANATGCGPLPYPALLWQLTDSTHDSILSTPSLAPSPPVLMDEDANGVPDLGDTWSTPNIGRIRMCKEGGSACNPNATNPADAADLRDVYVAIFGGGMDPENVTLPQQGGFLYMVDIETGKIIYKRKLSPPPSPFPGSSATNAGAAPMEPAAVDTDQDSYLDRIYIGTTSGFLYRVDLRPMSNGQLPGLDTVQARGLDTVNYDVERIPLENSGDPVWAPRVVFNANRDATGASVAETPHPRPLFHRPSVIFVANQGLFGLAFGTGDREDLWTLNDQPGRFYVFLDDTDLLFDPTAGEDAFDVRPRDEGDFQQIDVFDGNLTEDLFVTRLLGEKGWFLPLDVDERVITNSFSLAGITVFSSFLPDVAVTSAANCDPLVETCPELTGTCGDKKFETATGGLCAKTGASRLFVVGTTNANAFLEGSTEGSISRFAAIDQFVTSPFTEPGQNPNDASEQTGESSDDLSQTEINVMNALMGLFPENCKFANYRIDIKTIAADTRVERLAAVPICIVQKNWKEF